MLELKNILWSPFGSNQSIIYDLTPIISGGKEVACFYQIIVVGQFGNCLSSLKLKANILIL